MTGKVITKNLGVVGGSTVRAKKIYDIETAAKLAIDDNLEVYNFHKSYFENFLPSNKNLTLLDFGCGTGRYLELQKLYKKVYLLDISKHNLKIASEVADELEIKYETIQGSLNSVKNLIDIFFSVGVFGIQNPFNKKTVEKIIGLIDFNEYKRRQAPLGVKISDRNFDKGRRYPITNSWKPNI